jgi:multiple sugar transport system permease protein
MMFVPIAVTIPRYLVIANLGLLDTHLVHILPLMAMPVGLFLVKQFIDSGVPDALVEAARIDGASDYFIVWKIITPLVKPAIATLVILSFQLSWNATEASSIFVERESLRTFAFLAGNLVDRSVGSLAGMGVAAAAALLMFIPNFIIFMVMQSGVMNTMAHSGIK